MQKQQIFNLEKLIKFRRELHQIAEISFEEYNTSKKIIDYLLDIGIDPKNIKRIAKTAIIVDIYGKGAPSGQRKCIAYRADMDALEMKEENPELSYQSKTNAAHMCGHDGHMTCLLGGVCKILEHIHEIPQDNIVRLLFQPAEEKTGGANPMIQEGCLEGVDEVYGFHQWPKYPEGQVAVKIGVMMSQVSLLDITFIGKGGHGSDPKNANDPLQPAIDFHVKFREMIQDFKNQGKENIFVSTLPYLHVGEAPNVIAEKCVIKGTLRSFDPAFSLEFNARFNSLVDEICEKYKCTSIKDISTAYPPVINHEKETGYVKEVCGKILGPQNVVEHGLPAYASEDFSYFTEKKPGCFFFLGTKREGRNDILHNSHFDFNDNVIPNASEIWLRLTEHRFGLKFSS